MHAENEKAQADLKNMRSSSPGSLGTRRMRPIANASRLAGHPDPELERRDHSGEREEGVSDAWADRAQGAIEPRGER